MENEELISAPMGRYGKYVVKSGKNFSINKSLNGIQRKFGFYNSLENAEKARDILIKNNWDISKVPIELYHIPARPYYIRHDRNRYVISKIIDGELKVFGTFYNKVDAIVERNRLMANNWEVNEENYTEEEYSEFIYSINDDFIVRKDGVVYGTFDNPFDAIDFRNYCIKINWKFEESDTSDNENSENIYLNDFEFESDSRKKIDNSEFISSQEFSKEEKESPYGSYIYKNQLEGYGIIKSVNGAQKLFGHYLTLENAQLARDILIENNWDITKIPHNLFYDSKHPKYISKHRNVYLISKRINGEIRTFGTFHKKMDAIAERNRLIINDWDGADTAESSADEKIDEFIYQIGDDFIVKKDDEIYGTFEDMLEAIEFRNYCVKKNWNL